jgi:hypothetical protein
VAAARRDIEAIAGTQQAVFGLVGEAQPRRARQQHDPFALLLFVPEAGRALLPLRDDAHDAQARPRQHCFGDLAGLRVGQRGEEVHGASVAKTPATARRHPA